ncbi:MAG: hypothetical protein SFV32_08995 [Opitutaceae bacterium]|nr:hypothetical protein [Opitutaceae bacterium]
MTSRLALLLAILGVALAILGGRWSLIGTYGTDVPEWDQWDAEGAHLLAPWKTGGKLLPGFFLPHNEHRVVLTKILNFAVTATNGQWDQQLLATINAFLPAFLAASLLLWSWQYLGRFPTLLMLPMVIMAWAGPLAWQNVLAGFHSQQFFLLLTSFWAIALLLTAEYPSRNWWLGSACAVLALGTMGSGFFAAATVAALLILRALLERDWLISRWPTVALCIAVVAVGWFSRVSIPWHESLRAQTFRDFAMSILESLRWPASGWWWALASWLPFAVLSISRISTKRTPSAAAWVVVGLGGWVLLQYVATAIMRGAGGLPPSPRYTDTVLLGLVVNALALGVLFREADGGLRTRIALASMVWAVAFLSLTGLRTKELLGGELAWIPPYRVEALANTRDYLVTRNPAFLERSRIPYPNVENFRAHLQRSALHDLFPASIRRPLHVLDEARPGPFIASGHNEARSVAGVRTDAPGLPAGFPRLGPEVTWGSAGIMAKGAWTSVPLKGGAGNLRFEVAGTWSRPNVRLELRSAQTNELLATVLPADPRKTGWQPAFVPCPSGFFVVVATDESDDGWIAFSSPRVEALASGLARRATANGQGFFWAGLACTLAAFALLSFTREPKPETTP